MIIGPLDLGAPSNPWSKPVVGQSLATVVVEGYETYVYSHGAIERKQTVQFWAKAWQGIGGAAANSQAAAKYLLKQVEELASSRDQQPTYIQWNATADPAASLNATELHDGWYYIDDFDPDYQNFVVGGLVSCKMTVTQVAPAAPRRVAMAYSGGALSSNYSGGALNLLSLPVGSTALEANFTRTGGEGAIPCILSPAASPEPVVLSATLANIFKGGVHVYDTINTGSNAVPTAASGLFVNANWVEVFYTDHDFVGDCVVTNGLQLLLFQTGTAQLCTCYLWNTAAANVGWQQYATLVYFDNATLAATLRSYSLIRVGLEECALVTEASSSGPQVAQHTIRLQRGRYEGRVDFRPQSQAAALLNTLVLSNAFGTGKISFNSTFAGDAALDASPGVPTDYGFGCIFANNTTYPFIAGFLYQNKPGSVQPQVNTGSTGLGDNTSLAINAQRSYGFFAIPYGVSGSYSTANLQQEMESATLSGGFASTADAGSSGGSAAKLPSGTVPGAVAVQTGWRPTLGVYDCWARIRVTSAASGTAQIQIGWYDITDATFVLSNTYAPSNFTTSYAWYKVAAGVTAGAHPSEGFRAISVTNNAATDFWLDEMVLVPKTLSTGDLHLAGPADGPQDLWQQFMYDRSVRLIRQ